MAWLTVTHSFCRHPQTSMAWLLVTEDPPIVLAEVTSTVEGRSHCWKQGQAQSHTGSDLGGHKKGLWVRLPELFPG